MLRKYNFFMKAIGERKLSKFTLRKYFDIEVRVGLFFKYKPKIQNNVSNPELFITEFDLQLKNFTKIVNLDQFQTLAENIEILTKYDQFSKIIRIHDFLKTGLNPNFLLFLKKTYDDSGKPEIKKCINSIFESLQILFVQYFLKSDFYEFYLFKLLEAIDPRKSLSIKAQIINLDSLEQNSKETIIQDILVTSSQENFDPIENVSLALLAFHIFISLNRKELNDVSLKIKSNSINENLIALEYIQKNFLVLTSSEKVKAFFFLQYFFPVWGDYSFYKFTLNYIFNDWDGYEISLFLKQISTFFTSHYLTTFSFDPLMLQILKRLDELSINEILDILISLYQLRYYCPCIKKNLYDKLEERINNNEVETEPYLQHYKIPLLLKISVRNEEMEYARKLFKLLKEKRYISPMHYFFRSSYRSFLFTLVFAKMYEEEKFIRVCISEILEKETEQKKILIPLLILQKEAPYILEALTQHFQNLISKIQKWSDHNINSEYYFGQRKIVGSFLLSNIQIEISSLLEILGYTVYEEYFYKGISFDIFVKELNLFIETNGPGHYYSNYAKKYIDKQKFRILEEPYTAINIHFANANAMFRENNLEKKIQILKDSLLYFHGIQLHDLNKSRFQNLNLSPPKYVDP